MASLGASDARERFLGARVAYLATADATGVAHVVPVTFAVVGDVVYWAVDHKPKRSTRLKRLENIAENPNVSLLVDHYDDDWDALWWARADGTGRVATNEGERSSAVEALAARYPQYADIPPAGDVVAIDVARWTGWCP